MLNSVVGALNADVTDEGAAEWDRQQPFEIHRVREPWLLPHPV